jgi:hypothetical protein
MCWTLNHQNIIEMAQGHISLSPSLGTEQSGAPQAGAILTCPILIELAQGSFSLYVYVNFMHLRKYQLGKLVSP